MPNRKLTSHLSLAIAIVFVAVAIFGFVTYRNTVAVRQGEAAIAHSYAVSETTRELFSSVKDMETGQQGFLITGQETYLGPFRAGLDEVDDEFARFRKLTQNHPAQQRRLDKLQQLLHAKRALLAETIRLRGEDAGFDTAREVVMAGQGKSLMDEMRQVVGEMLQEEKRLLAEREVTAKSNAVLTERFIVAGNLMTLALLVFSGGIAHFDRKKRNEAEADLRLSQAELGAIFESAADGIITFNKDLRIRLMNPAAAEMHRCDKLSALGRPLLDFVPSRFREFVANDIRDFVHSDRRTREFAKGIALRSDGSEFPCDGSLAKAATAGGEQFVTLLFRDLSESQARDAKIREQVEILNQVRDAILVCDMDDRIIFWNRGAESLYGYSAKQAIGQNVVELLFGSQGELWEAGREIVLKSGVYSTELPQCDSGGRDIIVEHRRSLIHGKDGKPTGQLMLHFDITARKNEEAHQRRSQRLESIGTLAGGISHDLNNVLTPILMSAKLLKRGGNHHDRLLDVIGTSAERGGKMIKKLLSFAGGEQAARERIDLREVLSETEEILRHTLPKNIELHVEYADDLHAVIGDATELSQVLMNLAINARDAMPDGGRLELHTENFHVDPARATQSDTLTAGPHLLIRISDTGSGISKVNLERSFRPILHDEGTRKGNGPWLGHVVGHRAQPWWRHDRV